MQNFPVFSCLCLTLAELWIIFSQASNFVLFFYSAAKQRRGGGWNLNYIRRQIWCRFVDVLSRWAERGRTLFLSRVNQIAYIFRCEYITLNYFSKKQFLSFAFAFSGTILFVVLLLVPPSSGGLMRESGCDTEALLRRPSSPARNRESFNVSAGSWRDGGFRLLFIKRQTWRQFRLVLPLSNGSGRTLFIRRRPTIHNNIIYGSSIGYLGQWIVLAVRGCQIQRHFRFQFSVLTLSLFLFRCPIQFGFQVLMKEYGVFWGGILFQSVKVYWNSYIFSVNKVLYVIFDMIYKFSGVGWINFNILQSFKWNPVKFQFWIWVFFPEHTFIRNISGINFHDII